MLGDEQQAVDAMQDVFVRILRRREDLDERASSSLLYTTATNVCLNRIRTRRRKPEDGDPEQLVRLAAAGHQLDRTEARSILGRLLGSQPESTATIAVLHLHDGLTLEQTAEAVGLSVSGVRKRLRKLKAALADLGHGPSPEEAP